MDPNATYRRFTEAMEQGDMHEAVEAAVDLSGWLNSGGCPPRWGHSLIDWWGMTSVLFAIFPKGVE